MGRLDEQVIIVTGGAMGIGWAYCQRLAAEGARVVVADIAGEKARVAAEELTKQGTEALAVTVDVSNQEDTKRMVDATLQRFGRLDGLVNNAAVFQRPSVRRALFEEIEVDEWDRVMAVNVRGPFLCCKAAVPHFKEQRRGKIVNISSGTIYVGTPMFAHYVTSKAAVIGITRTLARELGDWNVCVNAIAPGMTLSLDDVSEDRLQQYRDRAQGQCLKRVQVPEDLVGTVAFLCSADSDFITGQTIVVSGGSSMV